jgi:hypothetical protein
MRKIAMQTDEAVSQNQAKSKPKPLEKAKWINIIEDWEKSHETQKAYCERLGINLNTFVYMRIKMLAEKKKTAKQFVPVTVSETSLVNTAHFQMTITNSKGMSIKLPLAMDKNKLLELLQLLGW